MKKDRFLSLMGDSKRQKITIPILAVVLSLLVGALVFLLLGKNPITAYVSFLRGSGLLPKANYGGKQNMLTDFMSFLNAWTPMLLASLAVAVAMRSGLFNIGVSGQMLFAGLIGTVTVGYSPLPALVAKPLVILICAVSGAFVASIIGFLKYKWNISEVVSSIMLNYIVQYGASFCIKVFFLNPTSRQSNPVSAASRLSLMGTEIGGLKMDIPLGIIPAILAVFVVKYLFDKMKLGFEFRTIGANPIAARYAGINVGRNLVATMAISGLLAGMAGATYFLGYFDSMPPNTLTSAGFDAVAVSVLGNSTPIGILVSSFFITVIDKGSTYMNSTIKVRTEISSLIKGLILLFSACGAYFSYLLERRRQKLEEAAKPGVEKEKEGERV